MPARHFLIAVASMALALTERAVDPLLPAPPATARTLAGRPREPRHHPPRAGIDEARWCQFLA
jgi:hypothetical protein